MPRPYPLRDIGEMLWGLFTRMLSKVPIQQAMAHR